MNTEFKKFDIIVKDEYQSSDDQVTPMLINLAQIVSIKPIRIVFGEAVIDGFWIRTTNGKKYRATKIPEELRLLIDQTQQPPSKARLGAVSESFVHH